VPAAKLPSSTKKPPVALTIAGSDSGGNAGIQADLLTFSALGVYGTTAITCLTAQNPQGVTMVEESPIEIVRKQLRQVASFFAIKTAKTGMLFSEPIIREVADFFTRHRRIKLVLDPVMVATSGAVLLKENAIEALQTALIPLATIVTPNLDEAGVFLGRKPASESEAIDAARVLADRFRVPFLVKGGHLSGDRLVDVLARPKAKPRVFRSARIAGVDTHGSGCTLSAAIAANLAHGGSLEDAVSGSRSYLRKGLARPLVLGRKAYIAHC
jgi:hydroxymethylpyrimidine/phosphomethylpyrimidine kinase